MSPCLTDDALLAYLCGTVTAAEQESVSSHLDSCPNCLRRLDDLGGTPDPLVGALRGALTSTNPAEPAVLQLLGKGLDATKLGERVGPYRLIAKLGEGGMGTVYRARHERLGKEFALKVLPPGRHTDPARTTRFEREMRAVGRLEHPHIVRATDAGEHDGILFLAMELVDGIDLSRLVRRHGPLRVVDACEVVRQAALALQHAHEMGLIHRDVKPSNLLLTPDGTVKLLDLGLALAVEDPDPPTTVAELPTLAPELTLTGLALGTRDYMAPEQATDPHAVDPRADIYGLGAMLHFLLTGHPPSKESPAPSVLTDVLPRLLAQRPEDRFASAADVASEFDRRTTGHDLPALASGRTPRSTRKRRWIAVAVAACVTLLGVGIAAATSSGGNAEVGRSPVPPISLPSETAQPSHKKSPPLGRLPMTVEEARALQKAWADHLGQPVVLKNSLGMELALIPPAEFGMSATYWVKLTRPYRIGTLEVTAAQFQQFIAANPKFQTDAEAKRMPSTFLTRRPLNTFPHPRGKPYNRVTPGWGVYEDLQPITYLSWDDATAFLQWLSRKEQRTYRLPTHAEWTWACRAGAATRFYWGEKIVEINKYAWTRLSNVEYPQHVGLLAPNAWGLHDMLGNAAEMVQDFVQVPQPAGQATDPIGPASGTERILCGGFYMTQAEYALPTVPAAWVSTRFTDSSRGLRVVVEP